MFYFSQLWNCELGSSLCAVESSVDNSLIYICIGEDSVPDPRIPEFKKKSPAMLELLELFCQEKSKKEVHVQAGHFTSLKNEFLQGLCGITCMFHTLHVPVSHLHQKSTSHWQGPCIEDWLWRQMFSDRASVWSHWWIWWDCLYWGLIVTLCHFWLLHITYMVDTLQSESKLEWHGMTYD